ncbi:hypothetical protein CH341_15835 [Rhodoplanes roseus]|uniref:Uncharacterized protein n=1 Tax=Rhodoplanes roseus TaxID=29409 RepID=A0A327L0U3_9BRAD|nr:hypothetical protein CH341_15835 [Rhodoplanes roseus]
MSPCAPGAAVAQNVRRLRAALLGACLAALAVGASPARAAGLDCPEVGPGGVPALTLGDRQIARMTSGNAVDLGDEIGGLVAKLKDQVPPPSDDMIGDMLIAAYCPVVAGKTGVAPAEKWRLMRQFERALYRRIGAAQLPQGSAIIADVPLPPAVFETLRRQAETAGHPPAAFMAGILTKAAGQ